MKLSAPVNALTGKKLKAAGLPCSGRVKGERSAMTGSMTSYMPVRLFTGKDCIRNNAKEFSKYGDKALIVTGKNSARVSGALTDVTETLDDNGISYILYDKITQNPLLTDCMEAGRLAAAEKCTFIIGIGGGSPLDAAKCAAVFAANPEMDREGLYSLVWPNKPLPLIAVGTTAGTGSEVTKVSVITTPEGRKKSFHHEDIFPAAAFGDPAYTMSLSPSFTASTGIDALAHAAESYFSRLANDLSRSYAVEGIRLLLPALNKTAEQMQNSRSISEEPFLTYEERSELYHGSIYAGLAINVTSTCLPHTMGYLLTEQHQIPHGFACAVFLPAFLEINREAMPDLYETFFPAIGTGPEELNRLISALTSEVRLTITEDEINREHSRWINNASIKKGWGEIPPEFCDDLLRKIDSIY